MKNLLVKDLMIKNTVFVDPDDTLEDVAVEMKDFDCGALPVGKKSSVKGMITDRDIIIRAIAAGKDPAKEKARNYMSAQAYFCKESDTIIQAAEIMKKHKVSRLIVKNDNDKVSGILSFGFILRENANPVDIAAAVSGASKNTMKAA